MENRTKLGYDDISIVPAPISTIRHRCECDCYIDGFNNLPIFTAPMANVVDEISADTFCRNGINVIYPRTIPFEQRINLLIKYITHEDKFIAFSLDETQRIFLQTSYDDAVLIETIQRHIKIMSEDEFGSYKICIDIANGHMSELINTIKEIKTTYGNRIQIMAGNIAHPETYKHYEEAGCDYVRCNIGSGSRCVCAGTKIRMSNGELKNIEDVAIGDLVKTTDGDFEVVNTFNKCVDKTILINNNIECTHGHKFLVVRKTDIPTTGRISDDKIKEISFYIEAEKLTDDYLLVSE